MLKLCSRCNKKFPVTMFNKNKRSADGLGYQCKSCKKGMDRKSRLLHRDQRITYDRNRWHARREHNLLQRKLHAKIIEGYTSNLWQSLSKRTINGSNPTWSNSSNFRYLIKSIKLEITYEELANLVKDNWKIINSIWSNGKKVSIERIDNNGHYSKDNIEFISLNENSRRSANLRWHGKSTLGVK